MNPIIEKVARAIADANMEDYAELKALHDEMSRAAIRATLEGLLENESATALSKADAAYMDASEDGLLVFYRAMISQAIAELDA
jgi:hypothetical protein